MRNGTTYFLLSYGLDWTTDRTAKWEAESCLALSLSVLITFPENRQNVTGLLQKPQIGGIFIKTLMVNSCI